MKKHEDRRRNNRTLSTENEAKSKMIVRAWPPWPPDAELQPRPGAHVSRSVHAVACHLLIRERRRLCPQDLECPRDVISGIEKSYDNQDSFEKTYRTVPGRIHVPHGDCLRRVDVRRWRFEEPERLKKETVQTKREHVNTVFVVGFGFLPPSRTFVTEKKVRDIVAEKLWTFPASAELPQS